MLAAILIISFIVIAIHATYQEGEIFECISIWGEKHLPEKLQKPVFGCPKCMIPWYGLPIYIIGNWLSISYFQDARAEVIVFVIISAIGFTAIYLNMIPEK